MNLLFLLMDKISLTSRKFGRILQSLLLVWNILGFFSANLSLSNSKLYFRITKSDNSSLLKKREMFGKDLNSYIFHLSLFTKINSWRKNKHITWKIFMVNSRQIPTTLNWLQDKNSLTHQPASTAFFWGIALYCRWNLRTRTWNLIHEIMIWNR